MLVVAAAKETAGLTSVAKEVVKVRTGSFGACLAWGIPEAVDRYQEARRTKASVIMVTKTWV